MKHTLTTAAAVLCCLLCAAADTWTSYFKTPQLEIQYRYADCHDNANGIHQQKVLLRFINLTGKNAEVSFTKSLEFNNGKQNNAEGKTYTVLLSAGETKEAACEEHSPALYIFSKQLNFKSTALEKFELKNISVKEVQ